MCSLVFSFSAFLLCKHYYKGFISKPYLMPRALHHTHGVKLSFLFVSCKVVRLFFSSFFNNSCTHGMVNTVLYIVVYVLQLQMIFFVNQPCLSIINKNCCNVFKHNIEKQLHMQNTILILVKLRHSHHLVLVKDRSWPWFQKM